MKLSASVLALSAMSVSAFTQPAARNVAVRTQMAEEEQEAAPVAEEMAAVVEETPAAPAAPVSPQMSMALPWMERPAALDGTLAGDVGFDPVGFAKTQDDLLKYREAEIKHGRLAMLAAAGWPMSELLDKKLANALGWVPVVDSSDRAPSVLNGGLGKVSPAYWAACLALGAAVDLYGIKRQESSDYFPGNLGFDPLGMYPKDEAGQKDMQLKELKNGRLAMIAITAFAFQEFVQKIGVVDETPIFFKPFNQVMYEYANSGYIYPDNM
eukprot:CAMPEP_0168754504 /NCGR_PEP_ID=MMETSP0724-20121128/19540_1 /TAXON_ID=265536 /ORGANISM="Amphiprora sp., Strain CCMP467" /LENGTH=267 /DNA_ID=CAMNT_0008802995 /DNA_START=18 /DNA_END=821 /DNA_ORIENTATION=+